MEGREGSEATRKKQKKDDAMEILNILFNTSIIRKNAIDGLAYCNSHIQVYEIKFLLNTCALQAKYLSKTFTKKRQSQGYSFKKCHHTICSPINGGICEISQGILTFTLKYLIFSTNKYVSILIEAQIFGLE